MYDNFQMPDKGQLELSFRVAGISLILRFQPQSVMPISHTLLAFQADLDEEIEQVTIVEFISEPPDHQIHQERLRLQPVSPIHMSSQGENLLFTCPIGQCLACL